MLSTFSGPQAMLALWATSVPMPWRGLRRPPHPHVQWLGELVALLWRAGYGIGSRSAQSSRSAPSLAQTPLQGRVTSFDQTYGGLRPCLLGSWLLGWGSSLLATSQWPNTYTVSTTSQHRCATAVTLWTHALIFYFSAASGSSLASDYASRSARRGL